LPEQFSLARIIELLQNEALPKSAVGKILRKDLRALP